MEPQAPGWMKTVRLAVVSGTVASVTSTVTLALLAYSEGKGALQPINSTSHWLHGEQASQVKKADVAHTAIGYATYHAATVFWAILFERSMQARQRRSALGTLKYALATSALAVAVDYGATPRRFTPGWEFVLTKRSMAVAYGAMAIGLAIGASVARSDRRSYAKQAEPIVGRFANS